MKKLQKILSLTALICGLVVSCGAVILWFELGRPLQQSITQTDQSIHELRGSVAQLKHEVSDLPATLKATRESLEAAAQATTAVDSVLHTGLGELLKMFDTLKANSKTITEFGDLAKKFADGSANIPLPIYKDEFQALRTALYHADSSLKSTASQITQSADSMSPEIQRMAPVLHNTLKSTSQALELYGKEVSSLEAGVIPTLPGLLDVIATELEQFVGLLKMVLPAFNVISLVLFFMGIAFAAIGLKGVVS